MALFETLAGQPGFAGLQFNLQPHEQLDVSPLAKVLAQKQAIKSQIAERNKAAQEQWEENKEKALEKAKFSPEFSSYVDQSFAKADQQITNLLNQGYGFSQLSTIPEGKKALNSYNLTAEYISVADRVNKTWQDTLNDKTWQQEEKDYYAIDPETQMPIIQGGRALKGHEALGLSEQKAFYDYMSGDKAANLNVARGSRESYKNFSNELLSGLGEFSMDNVPSIENVGTAGDAIKVIAQTAQSGNKAQLEAALSALVSNMPKDAENYWSKQYAATKDAQEFAQKDNVLRNQYRTSQRAGANPEALDEIRNSISANQSEFNSKRESFIGTKIWNELQPKLKSKYDLKFQKIAEGDLSGDRKISDKFSKVVEKETLALPIDGVHQGNIVNGFTYTYADDADLSANIQAKLPLGARLQENGFYFNGTFNKLPASGGTTFIWRGEETDRKIVSVDNSIIISDFGTDENGRELPPELSLQRRLVTANVAFSPNSKDLSKLNFVGYKYDDGKVKDPVTFYKDIYRMNQGQINNPVVQQKAFDIARKMAASKPNVSSVDEEAKALINKMPESIYGQALLNAKQTGSVAVTTPIGAKKTMIPMFEWTMFEGGSGYQPNPAIDISESKIYRDANEDWVVPVQIDVTKEVMTTSSQQVSGQQIINEFQHFKQITPSNYTPR